MDFRDPMKASLALVSTLLALGCLPAAHAGRPLTVDDANVNDPGAGHVEIWSARLGDKSRGWTVAPAYGLMDGVEVGAAFTRDTTNKTRQTAVQAKFRFTPSSKDGCNWGGVIGAVHQSGSSGNAPYLNGLFTCNGEWGSIHTNLGVVRPSGGPSLGTWGLAFERELSDAVTLHIETFGQRHDKPTLQVGARTMLGKSVQIDGTIGRQNRNAVFSLGLKLLF